MRKPPPGRRPPEAPADLPVTRTLTDPRAADPRKALTEMGERLVDEVEAMNREADEWLRTYGA